MVMAMACSFSLCQREPIARGLCSAHYRQDAAGRPLTALLEYKTMPYGTDRMEWLWSLVDKESHDSCWLWLGGKIPAGYGKFVVDGKQVYAHRYIYELTHNTSLEDCRLVRVCSEPSCVFPGHMEVR